MINPKRREEKIAYLLEINKKLKNLESELTRGDPLIFATYDEMIEWLQNPLHLKQLVPGQSIFIKDPETPDYWFTGEEIQVLGSDIPDLSDYPTKKEIVDIIYPVGTVMFRATSDSPQDYYEGTRWQRISEGLFIQTGGENLEPGEISGSLETDPVRLTSSHLPSHTHTLMTNTGPAGRHFHQSIVNVVWQPGYGLAHGGNNAWLAEGNWPNSSGGTYRLQTETGVAIEHSHSINGNTGSAGQSTPATHTHTINPRSITLAVWKRVM